MCVTNRNFLFELVICEPGLKTHSYVCFGYNVIKFRRRIEVMYVVMEVEHSYWGHHTNNSVVWLLESLLETMYRLDLQHFIFRNE